jgi:peptidoglycan L-alanyl-D-glutamate endopeptidase CwlK
VTGLSSLNRAFRPYAAALFEVAASNFPSARITSTKRGAREQRALYAAWVAGRSRYPAAAPGTSKHERGLAFDIGGLSPRQLAQLGALWESWGGRWGGRFSHSDPIHFEA